MEEKLVAILNEMAEYLSIAQMLSLIHISMEGITVAEDRLKKLSLNKTNPQTDDEKKVAGYRDVLTSISCLLYTSRTTFC